MKSSVNLSSNKYLFIYVHNVVRNTCRYLYPYTCVCVCICFCKYLRTYTSTCMNTYTLHICTCIENAMLTMKTHYKSLSKRIKAKPLDPQSKWRGQGRGKPRRVGKIIRKLFALEFRIQNPFKSRESLLCMRQHMKLSQKLAQRLQLYLLASTIRKHLPPDSDSNSPQPLELT